MKRAASNLNTSQFNFRRKNRCNSPLIRQSLAIGYDILTAIVSLLDVITDLIVLAEFYILDRMPFFYASLTILIIAQIAYCIAFWFKFHRHFQDHPIKGLIFFLCLLPFSLILSFIFYFTGDEEQPLYIWIGQLIESFSCHCTCCNCCKRYKHARYKPPKDIDPEKDALKQWVRSKVMKHIGFVIEALIEAFPQSILQLIAIVYFNDTNNYISMSSILLSMLSVSSKSFILSVAISYNWKSALFNWTCCITDFIGIFFIVSFAFYVPPDVSENDNINPYEMIRSVWLYSTIITVVPFAFCGSIAMNYYYSRDWSRDYWCGAFIFIQLAWAIGFALTIMAMTISCFLIIAMLLAVGGLSNRLGNAYNFYLPLISFVVKAKKINIRDGNGDLGLDLVISKEQHRIIRICCINRVLFDVMKYIFDKNTVNKHDDVWRYNKYQNKLHNYLCEKAVPISTNTESNCTLYPYYDVKLNELQSHSFMNQISRKKNLFKAYKTVCTEFQYMTQTNDCCDGIWIHFCLPLYFVGRIFNMLLVIFIICYLAFGYNIYLFTGDIPIFQTVMLVFYVCLILLLITFLLNMLTEQYYSMFILPATKKFKVSQWRWNRPAELVLDAQFVTKTQYIMEYYHSIISRPVAVSYCIRIFGRDVTLVIMNFYGMDHSLETYV